MARTVKKTHSHNGNMSRVISEGFRSHDLVRSICVVHTYYSPKPHFSAVLVLLVQEKQGEAHLLVSNRSNQ